MTLEHVQKRITGLVLHYAESTLVTAAKLHSSLPIAATSSLYTAFLWSSTDALVALVPELMARKMLTTTGNMTLKMRRVTIGKTRETIHKDLYCYLVMAEFTFHAYRISSNRRRPRIVAVQSETLERNKCCLQIVAAASKQGTCTRVWMISEDSHHTSARSVRVVQVVPTADSRTERLCILLTVSSSHHHLSCTYLIQLLLKSLGFPNK